MQAGMQYFEQLKDPAFPDYPVFRALSTALDPVGSGWYDPP